MYKNQGNLWEKCKKDRNLYKEADEIGDIGKFWVFVPFCAYSMKIDKWAPYVSGMILHRIRVFLLRTHPMPLPANAAINQNRKSNQPISSAKLFKSGNLSRKSKYLRHFNTGLIVFFCPSKS